MAKVMISMPQDMLGRLDEAAASAGKSRSELLRDALRLYLIAGAGGTDRAAVIARMRERTRNVRANSTPERLVRRERKR
jgi:metal-responsive CopG/Arc/MetJ family transcriptional regulator